MFGKRWCQRDGEKSEEATQIVRRGSNKITIPFHHVCGFAQFIQHWTAVDRINWMQLERKRGYDAKISTTAANGPEQIGIFIRIRSDKFAVRKHDVG